MLPPLSTIRDRRKKLGWTQKMLASKSGVSQSAIAKIENGKLVPVMRLRVNCLKPWNWVSAKRKT